MIQIPWQSLDTDTLSRLLEEIVTRDGTDYGVNEKSTWERLQQARSALETGRAVLVWNEETETASLVEYRVFSD